MLSLVDSPPFYKLADDSLTLHSCYEITSPCGRPTQRVRVRMGVTQGSRRRYIISLVKRRAFTNNKVTIVALVLK